MWRCLPWLFVSTIGIATGCANQESDRVKVYPTHGAVFFNEKPAAGAVVRVHGADGIVSSVLSRGVVQTDGSFSLTTFEADDGVPAGHYKVSVYWRQPGHDEGQDGSSLISERYSRPETSGLEVEVQAVPENKLSPIILKR